MKIIAEIVGYMAVATTFIMNQQSSRKRIILFRLIMDFLWITHFLLLHDGYTIVLTTTIAVFRELVFYNRDKKFFSSKIWLAVFIVITASTPIFSWIGIVSIFPAINAILATVSFWIKSVKTTKKLLFLSSVCQMIYLIAVQSYSAITGEILAMMSIIFFFIRNYKKENLSVTEKANEV